jgi:transposase
VPRPGRGHPRCRPDHVVADKAYASRGLRAYLRKCGIAHTIPEKRDQQRHRRNRGRDGGRPPQFDRDIYRRRPIVERCFNRLKGLRGTTTRYDETATSYEAAGRSSCPSSGEDMPGWELPSPAPGAAGNGADVSPQWLSVSPALRPTSAELTIACTPVVHEYRWPQSPFAVRDRINRDIMVFQVWV